MISLLAVHDHFITVSSALRGNLICNFIISILEYNVIS
jgi:hypothetical protein